MAARNVVDGLKLHRRWQKRGIPFGAGGLPEPGTPEQAAIESELAALDDLVDALADAAVAEGVHHLVRGNTERATATLAGLGRGDMPPPELEFPRTPRTGAGLTHRCLVVLHDTEPGTGWSSSPSHVRARAEPRLEAWAATLFGDPDRARCRAGFVHPGSDEIVEPPGLRDVSLRELDLSPLDLVYAGGTAGTAAAELEQRVRLLLRRTAPADIPADTEVLVLTGRADGWPPDVVSFDELAEVARAARDVVTGARPLDARDLDVPSAHSPVGVDTEDLAERADQAVAALGSARDQLAAASAAELADALVTASRFGVDAAVPEGAEDADRARAGAVADELDRRLANVAALEASFDREAAGPDARRDHDTRRMAEVFGEEFRVLPVVRPENGPELTRAFATGPAGTQAEATGPLPAVTWIQRAARVRPRLQRLCDLLLYAEALGTGAELDLATGQLPFREGDRWVGLPVPPGERFPDGRLSLAAHAPAGVVPGERPLAGLHIDEWQDVVPADQETTGVAFNYDQPDSRAPQAILLAVPPDTRARWDSDTMADVLMETLELARLRAVDPDTLADVGHYLPAVCLATNIRQSTISTRFDEA